MLYRIAFYSSYIMFLFWMKKKNKPITKLLRNKCSPIPVGGKMSLMKLFKFRNKFLFYFFAQYCKMFRLASQQYTTRKREREVSRVCFYAARDRAPTGLISVTTSFLYTHTHTIHTQVPSRLLFCAVRVCNRQHYIAKATAACVSVHSAALGGIYMRATFPGWSFV